MGRSGPIADEAQLSGSLTDGRGCPMINTPETRNTMKITVTKRVEMDGKVVDMSVSAEIPEELQSPSDGRTLDEITRDASIALFESMNFPRKP